MAKVTDLTAPEPSRLPALVNTPALEIDSGDITLPRVRIAQGLSNAVTEGLVKLGDIFSGSGADDPDPIVLYSPGNDADDGVLVHVIGMKKGKSLNTDGELETWAFNDPDAPPEARTTYDYSIVLPEHDEEVPYKLLLAGSSSSAAKIINTVLKKNEGRGPAWNTAFRVKTAERSTTKGTKTHKYHVARVRQVDADQKNVELAEGLAALIVSSQVTEAPATPTSQPAI